MSYVIHLVTRFESSKQVASSALKAEKAKVTLLQDEAKRLYLETYEEYNKMQSINNISWTTTNKIHPELHIAAAEAALASNDIQTAKTIVTRFFLSNPQHDQFYCRSKLVYAQVLNFEAQILNGAELIAASKRSFNEVIDCLDVAIKSNNLYRYKFLIYNTTLVGWKIIQPFLREKRAQYFMEEMSKLCSALESINDINDRRWRLMLLAGSAQCYYDGSKTKEATDQMDIAIDHALGILDDMKALQERHENDIKEATEQTDSLMVSLRDLDERIAIRTKPPKIDPDAEDDDISKMQDLGYAEGEEEENKPKVLTPQEKAEENALLEKAEAEEYSDLKGKLDIAQAAKSRSEGRLRDLLTDERTPQEELLISLCMTRVHMLPGDFKKIQGLPYYSESIRAKGLIQLQAMISNAIPDKDWETTFNSIITELDVEKPGAVEAETLLDACRYAWRLNLKEIAINCSTKASAMNVTSPVCTVKKDLCEVMRTIAELNSLKPNEVLEIRTSDKEAEGLSAERRIEAVKLVERVLTIAASRLSDGAFIEEVCIVLWNASLPLLQPHLRKHIHRAFTLAVDTLEDFASPNMQLRTQLHFEVCKCEDAADFVGKAKIEGKKSVSLDYGIIESESISKALTGPQAWQEAPIPLEIDHSRVLDMFILPIVNVLELRSSVYDAPADVEGQVLMTIQQAKESKSKGFQSNMLRKATVQMLEGLPNYPYASAIGLTPNITKEGENEGKNDEMSVTLKSNSDKDIEDTPLEDIRTVLNIDRSNGPFEEFSKLVQCRSLAMAQVSKMVANLKKKSAMPTLQAATMYCLSIIWDPSDAHMHSLITTQAELHYSLVDSLVESLNELWIDDEVADSYEVACNDNEDTFDPRALGLKSPFENSSITEIKALIITCLQKGMELAMLIKDFYTVQNAIVYFWNLHLHIFRNNLYEFGTEEFSTFVDKAVEIMDVISSDPSSTSATIGEGANMKLIVDERLRISLSEARAGLAVAGGDFSKGIDLATKAGLALRDAAGPAPTPCIYNRKSPAELATKYTVMGARAGAGGKGGGDAPKFDHPLLNVFAMLRQAEMLAAPPAPKEGEEPISPADSSILSGISGKVKELLEGEVAKYFETLNWDEMNQALFDQLKEMQAEAWTRLTRMYINIDNIHGAQESAEICLQLVAEDVMKSSDQKRLSTRVWRWISICERYFGIAIARIISPEGQDPALQYELRLAAMRHFSLACNFGAQAQVPDCAIEAGICAWNVSLHMVEVTDVRESLMRLQRQIIESLLPICKETNDDRGWEVCQQMYVSMIDEESQLLDWDSALKLVLEAFAQLPQSMHKPLWKWRVVVMSKKGKNVLDSLQKMKESDKSLQARVFGILARSASNPKQQLEAYHQAVEILAGDVLRVDYLLETCQWMASSSIPKAAINDVLFGALDAIYEAEELELNIESTTNDNDTADGDDKSQSQSGSQRSGSSRRSSRSKGSKATKASGASNKSGGRKSISKPPSRALSRKGSRATKTIITTTLPGMEESADRFTFQHADMAVRAFGMAMLLADDEPMRVKRALEVVHFVRRGLDAWYQSLLSAYKVKEYMKQPSGWRDLHEFEDWEPSYPLSLVIPELEKPLDLLSWCPNAETHPELVELTTTLTPNKVPSSDSILSPTLLVHYMLEITNTLCMNGFITSALGCLGYVRACIWFIAPVALPSNERVALFAVIDTRVKRILFDSGAMQALMTLPKELGNTGIISSEYLASLGSEMQKVAPVEALPNEQLCIFGFESFTHAIQGVKVVDCWMNIASDLIACGQLGMSDRIIRSAYSQFSREKNTRGILRSTGLLAELDMIRGRYKDALAMVMASDESAKSASDALELVKRVSILINSQINSGEFDTAIDTCSNALILVEALTQVEIQPQSLGMTAVKRGISRSGSALTSAGVGSSSVKPGSAMTAMSNAPPLPPSAGGQLESVLPPSSAMSASAASAVGSMVGRSSFTGGVVRKSKSDMSANVVETSYNNIVAIVSLVISMCECMVSRAINTADPSRNIDILQTIRNVCDRIDETHPIVAAVHGSVSLSSAELLHKKGQLIMKLINFIDDFKSAKLHGIDEEGYPDWLETTLKEASTTYQYASDVIRGILSRIPVEEYSVPNKSNNNNDNDIVDTDNNEIPLQSLLKRKLAVCMLEHAQVGLYLGSVQGDELPPLTQMQLLARSRGSGVDSMGEVIDKYLAATLPAPELTFDDAKVPPVYMSALLVSGVRSLASGLHLEGIASSFSTICELKRYLGMGLFRNAWSTSVITTANEEGDGIDDVNTSLPIINEEGVVAIDAVIGAVPKLLDTYRYDLAISGLSAVVEALGSNSSNATKACENLLWLQSLSARDFMLDVWKNSLNPTSEAAATIKRIEKLETQYLPNTESMIQLITERAYLQKIAPAAKRLLCTTPPSEILEKIPTTVTLVSIQLCSRAKTLYVGCGSSDASGEDTRTWKLDRLELSERSRRRLQELLTVHNMWTTDATKFVAKFGDAMSFDQILNGIKSKFADKAMDAAENMLEARLNQTLTDLYECLLPLIGPKSVLQQILTSLNTVNEDGSSNNNNIMLLIDHRIQNLPWEGLALFNSFQGRISRDFSLHMLGHRVHYSFNDGDMNIKSSSMRVVVDPFRDDEGITMTGIERPSLREFIGELCTQYTVGGGKWTPMVDGPSSAPVCLYDWTKLSADSKVNNTNIFMLCPGRLGGLLPPRELSVLSLEGVHLMMIMDKGYNDSSYRRLNTGDNVKGQDEIAAESSLSMAVLLSLAGVGCIIQTQWALNFCSLQRLSRSFWSNYSGNNPDGLKEMSVASAIGAAVQVNNEENEKLKEIYPDTTREEENNNDDKEGKSEGENDTEGNINTPIDENKINRKLKSWIALAFVAYGTSFVSYSDA